MIRPVLRLAVVVLVALAQVSCAGLSRRVGSSVGDYDQYRRVRTAPSFEQRLAEGWAYVQRYPDGRWNHEIKPWFESVEARFVEMAWDDAKRLQAYLRILPDGPHATLVRRRLEQFAERRRLKERRARESLEQAREREIRFQRAETSRNEFIQDIVRWLTQLARFRSFGERVQRLPPEFLREWQQRGQAPACEDSRCRKMLTAAYQVPRAHGLSARTARYEVSIDLVDGAVVSARVSGPLLFSRLGEAILRITAAAGDLQARTETLAASVQLAALALQSGLPESDCQAPVVSPVLLARECQGVRLEMLAATGPEEDDRVQITALSAASPEPVVPSP